MDLDQELLAPRYSAAAQAHWLTTRGAQLLTGRPREQTRLLVQTRQAEHEVVRALVAGRPDLVIDAESPRREAVGFPPFGALAEVALAVEVAETEVGVGPEPPALAIDRMSYLENGAPVEFTRSTYRGDTYDFVAELSSST